MAPRVHSGRTAEGGSNLNSGIALSCCWYGRKKSIA
jgi:hypothetical protein